MRHFKKAFLLAFVLTVVISIITLSAEARSIRNGVFRLHVRADGNTTQAQKIKLDVKDCVLDYVGKITEGAASAEEASRIAAEHIDEIRRAADDRLAELGCDYTVEAYVARESFPTKEYGGAALPCGSYNALVVNLGSGEGENWWCMIYPELCYGNADPEALCEALGESAAETLKNKESYKFRILEIAGILFE